MKKKLFIITLCMILLLSLLALTACKDEPEDYTYEPSSEYYNLVAALVDNGATTRAFSFFTAIDESYRDACVVQLDPADANETEPKFNSEDNFTVNALTDMQNEDYIDIQQIMVNWIINDVFPDRMGHQAFANNLTPGQKYFYRMGSPEKDTWSKWGTFTTDDGDDTFSFFHITDSQADTQERFELFGNALGSAFEKVGSPEFVLFTGDLTEDGREKDQWDMLFESMEGYSNTTSFSAACGNHEHSAATIAYNFALPLQGVYTYYAYEYGNALVVVLDTEDDMGITKQAAWLESVLAANTKKWTLVAFHKSFYSNGGHADASDTLRLKRIYTPILDRYKVDFVMSGHDHVYARTVPVDGEGGRATYEDYREEVLENGVIKEIYTNPDGSMFSINRTIGSKFYDGKGFNADVISIGDEGRGVKPVFSKIDISGDRLTYTAYEVDYDTGELTILDAFEIYKPS